MFRVVSCLAYEHNYWFVLVAAIVCVAGSLMTVRLYDRARQLEGFSRLSWVLLSGMAGGTAIWTTHFVAMLGFHPPAGYAYAPLLTLASLGFAMVFTAAGLYLAAVAGGTILVEAGGAVMGIGISVMHYTGMAGLDVAGHIEWQADLVVASIVLGVVFAALAVNRYGRIASGAPRCWAPACSCSRSAACISPRWAPRPSFRVRPRSRRSFSQASCSPSA